MKYRKLQINYEYEFDLFGIISASKGFKLAWSINQILSLELIKAKDIDFALPDGRNLKLSAFDYQTQNTKYLLFQNRLKGESGNDAGFVLPEMSKIDFFFRIDGETYPNTPEKVLLNLRDLPAIDYCMRIDINKLKSKENLLLY